MDRTIADVTEFNLSNDEKTLVYVVSSKNEEKNGVYTMNPRFGTAATPLKSGPGKYSGITWDEKQTKLAFFYDDSQVPSANLAPPPHAPGASAGSGTASATRPCRRGGGCSCGTGRGRPKPRSRVSRPTRPVLG